MGKLFVICWIISMALFYMRASSLFVISLILGVLNIWSLGILYNYKYDNYFPRVWTPINFVTSILGLIFMFIAIFR